jgi:hypothetical protein
MIKPFFWAEIVGKRRGFCLNSSTTENLDFLILRRTN